MDELERMQAEELDVYLTARLSGTQARRPKAVPAAEVDLLEGLLAFTAEGQPDPTFARELEHRLAGQARRRSAPGRTQPSEPRWLRGALSGTPDRGVRVNTRIGIYVAGALALAAILFVALVALTQMGPPLGEGIAQAPSPTVSAGIVSGPTPAPTATPAVIEPGPTPAVTAESPPTDEPPVMVPTVERGFREMLFCSMAMVGLNPSIWSTSGLFIWCISCLVSDERFSMYRR